MLHPIGGTIEQSVLPVLAALEEAKISVATPE
jgi:hypothetical protein